MSFARWESDELVYSNFYRRTNCRSDVLKTVWLARSVGVEVFSTVVYGIGSRPRTSDGDLNFRHRLDATAT